MWNGVGSVSGASASDRGRRRRQTVRQSCGAVTARFNRRAIRRPRVAPARAATAVDPTARNAGTSPTRPVRGDAVAATADRVARIANWAARARIIEVEALARHRSSTAMTQLSKTCRPSPSQISAERIGGSSPIAEDAAPASGGSPPQDNLIVRIDEETSAPARSTTRSTVADPARKTSKSRSGIRSTAVSSREPPINRSRSKRRSRPGGVRSVPIGMTATTEPGSRAICVTTLRCQRRERSAGT